MYGKSNMETYITIHKMDSQQEFAVYVTYGIVSFLVTLSIHLTLSSPLPLSISLFSLSVSPLLPVNKFQ